MYKKTFKAFTLPEILISLSVIIILSAVLLPSLAGARQRAARAAAVKTISTLRDKSEVLTTGSSGDTASKIYQKDLCTNGFKQDLDSINKRLGYATPTTVFGDVSSSTIVVNNSINCAENNDGSAWLVITDTKQKDTEKELFCTDYTGFAGVIQDGYSLTDWQCDADGDALVYGTGSGYTQGVGGVLCTGADCSVNPPCIYNPIHPENCPIPCKIDPATGKCVGTGMCKIDPVTGKPIDPDPTTPWNECDNDCDNDGVDNITDTCDKCDKDGRIGDVCPLFKSGFSNYVRAGLVINPDHSIVGAEMITLNKIRLRKTDKFGNINTTFDSNFATSFPSGITNDLYFGGVSSISGGRYAVPSRTTVYAINGDGTKDNSFSMGDTNGVISGTINLPSGDILVFGQFRKITKNAVEYSIPSGLVRINNTSGNISSLQYPDDGDDKEITAVSLQSNGMLTIFSGNGETNHAVRYNKDANSRTIDSNFSITPSVFTNLLVRTAIQDPDENYYLGTESGSPTTGIIKLDKFGSVDVKFKNNVGSGIGGHGSSIGILSDKSIIVGGQFTTFKNQLVNNLIRLSSDGIIDNTFTTNFGSGPTTPFCPPDNTPCFPIEGNQIYIRQVKIDTDDSILVAGQFSKISGMESPWVAKVEKNGKVVVDR